MTSACKGIALNTSVFSRSPTRFTLVKGVLLLTERGRVEAASREMRRRISSMGRADSPSTGKAGPSSYEITEGAVVVINRFHE